MLETMLPFAHPQVKQGAPVKNKSTLSNYRALTAHIKFWLNVNVTNRKKINRS